jgi:hypothetical protein
LGFNIVFSEKIDPDFRADAIERRLFRGIDHRNISVQVTLVA